MFRKWVEDIRVKTKDMDKGQETEYILAYYWYHILIAFLLLGLLCLLIYHLAWGRQKKVFSLAIVNQEIDYDRDQKLLEQYAESSGISKRKLSVDSDYLLSYGNVKLKDVKESSFEKFFLSWSVGGIDAAVMPMSFYQYCKEKDGEFVSLTELLPEETIASNNCFYEENNNYMGIYIEKTKLADDFRISEEDPFVLVFLRKGEKQKSLYEYRRFLEYVLQ